MPKFEEIVACLGATEVSEDGLRDFLQQTPWVDHDADMSRVAVLGRLSVWEEPDGRVYLILGLLDDSCQTIFLDGDPMIAG